MKKIIIGDTHGNFDNLNSLLERENPDVCISTGDFGYWPTFQKSERELEYLLNGDGGSVSFHKNWRNTSSNKIDSLILPENCKFYFIAGNHEHLDALDFLIKDQKYPEILEIRKNLFYCPTGSYLEIDGRIYLFMGGADSIDKMNRIEGISWFRQEVLREKDFYKINKSLEKIDVLISHTASTGIIETDFSKFINIYNRDSTWRILEEVYNVYRPKEHYFSHWHFYRKGVYKGIRWECLNQCDNEKWWKFLS